MITACGFLFLDKPPGITTFRALFPVKRAFATRRVGHAGTLDEPASGLIAVAVGKATRLISRLEAQEKIYDFRLCFGTETDTGDNVGRVTCSVEVPANAKNCLQKILPEFLGKQKQVPPAYSAVKIDGKRAHMFARKGEDVEMPSREIEIFSLEILERSVVSDFFLRCRCSKGTYIRSLGRDLGRRLLTAAHVADIRRIAIGDHRVGQALSPDDPQLVSALQLPEKVLGNIPKIILSNELVNRLCNGSFLQKEEHAREGVGEVFVACEEEPAALLARITPEGILRPEVRFID